MAEDKNGFLLYKDLIHSVRKLPKEKAGELFMHILRYVNDENPETEDFIIELAFEPVKQHLKRDLKKYKTKLDKKSESGRIGNLKKWHPEIYEKYESGLLSLEEAEKIAKDRKISHCDNFIANVADNDTDTVSDNVSVTVSDNDILLGKETKEEKLKKENSEELFSEELGKTPEECPSKKVAQKKVPEESTEDPPEEVFTKKEFKEGLVELGAKQNHVEDWFRVRDKRKAPYTRTAFDGFVNECKKHNYPVGEAVRICAESNWQGFKYSWVLNLNNNGKSNNQTGTSGNNTPAQQATYNIQEAAGRLAEDFAKGNIPGVYR
ncbi:DUF6291 domain-containing protein [Chryseobacterium gleum]|uniref:DUF6291 domain-containing protein n=1 Tax=Chryseobacterium gleum TaxID=250 RepID=UPI001E5C7423|nr:DUF6291 domain-containing protein [Chryseobacterium gleum]MCE4064312.1 DUF6291 domain-containing protein [Chryseobacterium gleum]